MTRDMSWSGGKQVFTFGKSQKKKKMEKKKIEKQHFNCKVPVNKSKTMSPRVNNVDPLSIFVILFTIKLVVQSSLVI